MTDDELVMTVIRLKRLTDSLLEAASAANAAAQAALDQKAEALQSLRQFLDEDCPHPADEHAEGTCEVCDWTFAIEAQIDELEAR